jgi:hypothetical protein
MLKVDPVLETAARPSSIRFWAKEKKIRFRNSRKV